MSESNAFGRIGMAGLLFLLFLALKLTGYIDWSWWWVFAPLWIPLGLAVMAILIVVIVRVLR